MACRGIKQSTNDWWVDKKALISLVKGNKNEIVPSIHKNVCIYTLFNNQK